jgi:hypothetical protein
VAAETGIDPGALLADSAMLYTIVDVLEERAKESRRKK